MQARTGRLISAHHGWAVGLVCTTAVACGDPSDAAGDPFGDTGESGATIDTSENGPDAGSDGGEAGPSARFDVGAYPDLGSGDDDCPGAEGELLFTYIWIANSEQGTVSKIDTRTGVEKGRYWTDPSMGEGNPSRTSVNLLGDMAVSNRARPSTTKIGATPSHCVDRNNDQVIQTSTGPDDVLDWGADECVRWHHEVPDAPDAFAGPRPTQWEAGESDDQGCLDPAPRLWIGYLDGAHQARFERLDGETGEILDEASHYWDPYYSKYGPYGGVVNARGDLFASGLGAAPLLHVDAETLEVTSLGNPDAHLYGMAIDDEGNPWIAGDDQVAIWDVSDQTWTVIQTQNERLRGVQIDAQGRAWAAGNLPCGLVQLDVDARAVVYEHVELPGCAVPVGVSIDFDGYVWAPDEKANLAFKLDPETRQVALKVTGLVAPYTYSDMTGAGLALVGNHPQG